MAIIKSLILILLIAVLTIAALLFLMLERQPSVPPAPALSSANVGALQILSSGNDPRSLAPGESGTLVLAENDLELALGYVLDRLQAGQADIVLSDETALVSVSARLPVDFADLYLNLKASVKGGDAFPAVTGLSLGNLQVPDWLSERLLGEVQTVAGDRYPEYRQLRAAIQDVSIDEGRLRVRYLWDPELLRQLSRRGGEWLLPGPLLDLSTEYRNHLRDLTLRPDLPRRVSASTFLTPLFLHALESEGDPVEENRALLLALSLYALDVDLLQLLMPGSDVLDDLPRHELQLYRRSDLARHFFTSIGLTLGTDAGLADNMGLLKEIEDARGSGSGFSFTDIGADRVGTRFAEFAVSNQDNARRLQQLMAQGEGESHYFPDLRELPEFLSQEQFEHRYGTTTSVEFDSEMEKIDLLISELPVFAP